jgi:hypothetical protein
MIKHEERFRLVNPDIVQIIRVVAAKNKRDILVSCGFRNKPDQEQAYATGASHAHWPDSDHNIKPDENYCRAVDLAYYPVDWDDLDGFKELREEMELEAKLQGHTMQPLIEFKNKKGQKVIDYDHFCLEET